MRSFIVGVYYFLKDIVWFNEDFYDDYDVINANMKAYLDI